MKQTHSDILREIHGLHTAVVTTQFSKLADRRCTTSSPLAGNAEKWSHQPTEEGTKLSFVYRKTRGYLHAPAALGPEGEHPLSIARDAWQTCTLTLEETEPRMCVR
jgi:hypothetical protein